MALPMARRIGVFLVPLSRARPLLGSHNGEAAGVAELDRVQILPLWRCFPPACPASAIARTVPYSFAILRKDVEGNPNSCTKAAYPMHGPESPYHAMKALPPPAECKVQGCTIEELEPQLNFRRTYALGFSTDAETKLGLLPYMRATQDSSLRSRQRRVLVDFGAGSFGGSVQWFLRWYPLDFTEVHAFEATNNSFILPQPTGWSYPELLQTLDSSSRVAKWGHLPIPDWALHRIQVHNKLAAAADKPASNGTVESVNVTRFILEELKLKEDDAVICKMDVEGAEWDILPEWLSIAQMPHIVDELWVQVHYNASTLATLQGGAAWERSREEAMQLFQSTRQASFFVHPWP